MKALKFVINGEEQEIPQGWWDGIGRTLYVRYDTQTSHWVLISKTSVHTTKDDIQNNVVLVFKWQSGSPMPTRIYDSNGDYIDFTLSKLISTFWDRINNDGILLGIIKEETSMDDPSIKYTFYPRYWGYYWDVS